MRPPDDFYPTNNKPSPLIGQTFVVTWRWKSYKRGTIIETRVGMKLVDVVSGRGPLTLIFEHGNGPWKPIFDIEWHEFYELELDGVRK